MFRWNEVKDIPVDERMATPFQRGNVCEDPERCIALKKKGIDPSETICPKCPVYTDCQQRGYLSQATASQRAKTQIFGFCQMFLDPEFSTTVEKILEPIDDRERLCIIDEMKTNQLFLECNISRNMLEEWSVNWQGSALGNFAHALLNVLAIETESDDSVVKRIRAVVQAFQQHEIEIVRQMCQVNVKGMVIARGTVDSETDRELARFTIEFEGGISAYIPLNNNAADRLTAMGLEVFHLESFELDKNIRIPMPIEQAIRFGILDMETVEKIQEFPRVYRTPDWTFWHQLKRFFAHYTRDADAPMIWYDNILMFWVPPVLHPSAHDGVSC